MAKKSKIVKNERRRAIVVRYAERRAELKEVIRRLRHRGSVQQQRQVAMAITNARAIALLPFAAPERKSVSQNS